MRRVVAPLAAVLASSLLFAAPSGGAIGGGGGPVITNTSSTTHHTTAYDLPSIDVFATRVTARLDGEPPIYDHTFAVPPSDPSVQAAFDTARADLTSAGATSVQGPSLLSSSSPTTSGLVSSVDVPPIVQTKITGPSPFAQTIKIGDDQSVPFVVEAGSENVNTNDHTEVYVTHQLTVSHQAVYGLTGLRGGGGPGTAPPAVRPSFPSPISPRPPSTSRARPARADIAIAARVRPRRLHVGQRATYTLTITNRGSGLATGLVVSDRLPGRVHSISVRAARGGTCTRHRALLTCRLARLRRGAHATVRIVVVAMHAGFARSTAHVRARQHDPRRSNNVASVTLMIVARHRAARPQFTG